MEVSYWLMFGTLLILLELILPGGIVVFLGVSSLVVALGLHYGLITTLVTALLTWFIVSIFSIIVLRSVFIKYFEGDSSVQNVDEDDSMVGQIVEVAEIIQPYKEGRVKFRDSFWPARSESELPQGTKGLIQARDGNTLIIKPII